jgi:hypothetical protein
MRLVFVCGSATMKTPTCHLTVTSNCLKAYSHLSTRHRHDPTKTRQENIVTVTLNGPVYIQRQRHDSDNRQTLKESELSVRVCVVPVRVCRGSMNRRSDTAQTVSCCIFLVEGGSCFSLSRAHHISLIMNTEQLIELVAVTHYCMT